VLAWCGGQPAGSIIALLFMTGLVAGFAHCGPMCGPFVMAQTAGDPHPPGWSRSNAACSFPTTSGAPWHKPCWARQWPVWAAGSPVYLW